MSKLGCICGHVIRDQTDNLPYKGVIIRDKHEDLFSAVSEEVASFVRAVREGKEREWMVARYGEDYADLSFEDSSTVHGLWCNFFIDHELTIYQCEECGRVHIEGKDNYFHSFKPDKPDSSGVLDVGLEA